jgi:hypothetical protein
MVIEIRPHRWGWKREDAGRFIVHAGEKLTAFVELEAAIRCNGFLGGLQESRQVLSPYA